MIYLTKYSVESVWRRVRQDAIWKLRKKVEASAGKEPKDQVWNILHDPIARHINPQVVINIEDVVWGLTMKDP